MLNKRRSGILLPISSLPSPFGIGDFGNHAYEFIDFLKKSGQTYWQILPMGPTGFGDSPYQSFSTFAGNPYFIDLNELIKDGLLSEEAVAQTLPDSERVEYELQFKRRFPLLKEAYTKAVSSGLLSDDSFMEFKKANIDWLPDYSLFMALKDIYCGKPWFYWPEDIRMRKLQSVLDSIDSNQESIEFYSFTQYLFFMQWDKLKKYANSNGIEIIGDIPIYVAFDSADCWSHPELFQLDKHHMPNAIAGCPPDDYAVKGQLWGNPLYNWEVHKKTGFEWWLKRIQAAWKLTDIIRIDHFRGFDEYYSIPYGSEDAVNGTWRKGPGLELFQTIKRELGDVPIIAEDLGFVTDSVRDLLASCRYPGMKVLEFAFNEEEKSEYLPYNYTKNCVVYTGTHDNETITGWYANLTPEIREAAIRYCNNAYTPESEIAWDYICLAMSSIANTCIIPMQDYLGLGNEARINTPSTLGLNWTWRMKQDAIESDYLALRIRQLTKTYGRLSFSQKSDKKDNE